MGSGTAAAKYGSDVAVGAVGLNAVESLASNLTTFCGLLEEATGGVSCWRDGYSGGIPKKIVGLGP